ncbi:hypothetical protein C8Q74DRAFT_610792 [Fomes fomentarius]|nr:hypothetical protein C8Q74DRAFT_610792 [Fomes fomentarius]
MLETFRLSLPWLSSCSDAATIGSVVPRASRSCCSLRSLCWVKEKAESSARTSRQDPDNGHSAAGAEKRRIFSRKCHDMHVTKTRAPRVRVRQEFCETCVDAQRRGSVAHAHYHKRDSDVSSAGLL